MTGSLCFVDYLASSGTSVWHRSSAVSKMSLLAALVGAVVTLRSPGTLAAFFALALALAFTARIPLRVVGMALAYPLLFSLLFVLSHLDGTWGTPLALVLRAVTAGLAAVWLVSTTPFPDLFAPLSRVLPRPAGDGLFLTYRAFFALVSRAELMWRALRMRGGLGRGAPPAALRVAGQVGEGLGTLVLHSFERSQRLYGAMRLRGHDGRVCGCRHYAEWTRYDLLPWGVALLVVLGAWALGGRP